MSRGAAMQEEPVPPALARAREILLATLDVEPLVAYYGCAGPKRFGECVACGEISFVWPAVIGPGTMCKTCADSIADYYDPQPRAESSLEYDPPGMGPVQA